MRGFSTVLVMLLACGAMPASAQAPATADGAPRLPLPQGYCALDPANAADREVFDIYGRPTAGGDLPLRFAVECAQQSFWRQRPLALDAAHTRNLVVHVNRFDAAPAPVRQRMPASACGAAREMKGQPENESLADVGKRMSAMLASFQKAGEEGLVGVVHQDGASCHVLVAGRGTRGVNDTLWILHVRATVVIKDRVLHFYESAQALPGTEIATLERLAALAQQDVRGALAANP